MEPAQKKQRTTSVESSTQTVPKAKRSDELTHVMLNWATDKVADLSESVNAWRDAHDEVQGRATRFFETTHRQAFEIDILTDRLHNEQMDNQRLIALALEMLGVIPEDRREAFGRRLTAVVGGNEIIDLTTEEALSDTESEEF